MKIQPLNISPLFFSAKAKEKKKSSQSLQNSEMTSIESAAIRSSRMVEVEEPNFWKQRGLLIKIAQQNGDKEAEELKELITEDNFEVAQILLSDEKYRTISRSGILEEWENFWNDIQKDFFKKMHYSGSLPAFLMESAAQSGSKDNIKYLDELCFDDEFPRGYLQYVLDTDFSEVLLARLRIYSLLRPNETIDPHSIAKVICAPENSVINWVELSQIIQDDEFEKEDELFTLYDNFNINNLDSWAKIHAAMKRCRYSDKQIHNLMGYTDARSLHFYLKSIEYIEKIPNFPKDIADEFILKAGYRDLVDEPAEEGIKLADKINQIRTIMLNNPELYIEGEYDSKEKMQEVVDNFLMNNLFNLFETVKVFDKETLIAMMRQRFFGAMMTMRKVSRSHQYFGNDEIEILKAMLNAKNIDGREFTPNEKIEFVELIGVYSEHMPFEKYNELLKITKTKPGRINIEKIKNEILEELFKKCKVAEKYFEAMSENEKKYWIKNCHHIFKAQNDTGMIGVLLSAELKYSDFKKYVASKKNENYNTYLHTQSFFGLNKLDFDSWFNPDVDNIEFKSSDTLEDKIKQIISQIEEDFESLRLTPAKSFIDKHFSEFINNDKFSIPEKYYNKQALTTFLKTAYELLDKNVFKRAQKNADNMNINKVAHLTLTIKSHLAQRIEDIEEIEDAKTKSLDLTIKMWDREPKKDLFQGNYSSCCIGIGAINQRAIFDYLTMPVFNMIELVDNKTNQVVGNALCYFALDSESKKPVFIIDNIEIAPKYKPSDKTGVELRNAITQYAKNIIRSVGASNDTPIYLGKSYNDIQSADLKTTNKKIEFIGSYDNLYLDAFGGWIDSAKTAKEAGKFYVLN